jgi:thiol-disulfide isomerase/thioredoxin
MIRPILALFTLFMSLYSWAQPMGGYPIGAAIRNFTLLNVANKQPVSLEDYSDKKIVVLIFTSNNCPYSKIYEDRIITLNNRYSDKGVIFLLINPASNPTEKNESIDAMRKKIQTSRYLFPYLADTLQRVAIDFGVTRLPTAFVLKRMENSFRLVYKGAIDDSPESSDNPQSGAKDILNNYLNDAIVAMNDNKSIKIAQTRPVGCILKEY